MKLLHDDHDQLVVMTLKGDLTEDVTRLFRNSVNERMQLRVRDFVLDLSHTEFIDSKGLEALLWLQKICGEQLRQVCLVACHENVRKILEITRLAGRFDCYEDLTSATKSLG